MGAKAILLLGVTLLGAARASPFGAPVAACDSLTPQHVANPQTSPSPYILQVAPGSTSTSFNVTLTSLDGSTFRGFILQARNAAGTAIGSFIAPGPTGDAQATDCPPNVMNTATHTTRSDKTAVTVQWNSPFTGTQGVNFKFSVVQTKNVFWVNQETPVNP